MFKGYYRRRFAEILGGPLRPEHGLGDDVVARLIRKRNITIPAALSDYYTVAGSHPINAEYNRLWTIPKLKWRGDHLILMEENQQVATWSLARADTADSNPVVLVASDSEPDTWVPEPYRLSQFIMAMWRWQRTGVQEKPERTTKRR